MRGSDLVIENIATSGVAQRARVASGPGLILGALSVSKVRRARQPAVGKGLVVAEQRQHRNRGLQPQHILSFADALMFSLDVVVRTLADAQRSDGLFRALDSIRNQNGTSARAIVVVNGDRYDPYTLAELERRPGMILHRLRRASTAGALAAGRRLVTAPYFAYLDDDDVLIADSLLEPVVWLESHPDCDVLISNGHFVKESGALSEFIHIADHIRIRQPALSLLDDGWLAPGAFVCRTKSVPEKMLDLGWDQMEWTHLAFEICAANKRLHFMDLPTALYYDTPGSMSKDRAHLEAALDLMRSIRSDSRMSAEVRKKADKKYRNVLHMLAARCCAEGDIKRAWRYHLASMRPPCTLNYLLFSRKLLWSTWRNSKNA